MNRMLGKVVAALCVGSAAIGTAHATSISLTCGKYIAAPFGLCYAEVTSPPATGFNFVWQNVIPRPSYPCTATDPHCYYKCQSLDPTQIGVEVRDAGTNALLASATADACPGSP